MWLRRPLRHRRAAGRFRRPRRRFDLSWRRRSNRFMPASPAPVSAASAAGGSTPAHPAPTTATHPQPVVTPSSAQDTVTSTLQSAGVPTRRGGSDPVPAAAPPPWLVAGTDGPQLGSEIVSTFGNLATRLGVDPRRLRGSGGARPGGAAALGGPAGQCLGVERPSALGRRAIPADLGRHAWGSCDPWGCAAAADRPPGGGDGARDGVGRRRVEGGLRLRGRGAPDRAVRARRARVPAASPAAPPPAVPAPPPRPGRRVRRGWAAASAPRRSLLFIIATICLLELAGDRMSLEAWAWRETLLSLRLERPG